MKNLLIIASMIVLFTNCNNSTLGGWSSTDRQKALKKCMEGAGDADQATAKKLCSCALDKTMKKYKNYDEADKNISDEEGSEMVQACYASIQGGENPKEDEDDKGKGGGLFGGGGKGWSKTDKNGFLSPCENGLGQNGYSEAQARQLCNCMLGKLEKKYSSLQQANDKGGEAAGAKVRQECEAGEGNDNDDNDN